MKKKRVVKGRSSRSSKKNSYTGRGPSGKAKHSKVAKLKKLAKARSRKKSKKEEKIKKSVKFKEPPMRFDVALQKYVPDLVAIKKLKSKFKKKRR